VLGASNFITRCNADYLILSDCDVILNIDLKKVLEEHIASGAFMTLVGKRLGGNERFESAVNVLTADESGRLVDRSCYKPEGEAVKKAVLLLIEENNALKQELDTLNDTLNASIIASLSSDGAPVCLFDTREDTVALRKLANLAHAKTGGTVAVFGGSDAEGYKVVLCGKAGMKALLAHLTASLPVRGGGSDTLVCGSVKATEIEIREAWDS
jgi:hypothetical protein